MVVVVVVVVVMMMIVVVMAAVLLPAAAHRAARKRGQGQDIGANATAYWCGARDRHSVHIQQYVQHQTWRFAMTRTGQSVRPRSAGNM